jgi:hypothetical protein
MCERVVAGERALGAATEFSRKAARTAMSGR